MAYLIIIAVSIILIYIPNAIFNPAGAELPWVYYLIAIAIFVVGEFLIDALVAIVGRKLPESWINPKKGMILVAPTITEISRAYGISSMVVPIKHSMPMIIESTILPDI